MIEEEKKDQFAKSCIIEKKQGPDQMFRTPPQGPRTEKIIDKRKTCNLPCIVCYKNQSGHFTNCSHTTYCKDCAENILLSCLPGLRPKCGILSCTASMDEGEDSLYHYFSQETKQKWDAEKSTKVVQGKIGSDQPLRNCQHPDCNGKINPETSQCFYCKKKHCRKCYRIEHQGECLGNSIWGIQFKVCNFCHGRLYKEGGCSRVTCVTCRRQICYECLEEWSTVHHGCESGGWIKVPWHFLVEKCCSGSPTNRMDELQRIDAWR